MSCGPEPWVQIEVTAYWWLVDASEKVRAGFGLVQLLLKEERLHFYFSRFPTN